MNTRYPPISKSEVIRLFVIDFEQGTLTWNVSPKYHAEVYGKEAGSFRGGSNGRQGYWHVKIGGRPYKRSHLMFSAFHDRWPSMIDHIDGNALNDAITNLREADDYQNAWNHRGRRKTTALPMGVRQLGRRFQVRICHRKQTIYPGIFPTVEQAHACYLKVRQELFGEYSGIEAK